MANKSFYFFRIIPIGLLPHVFFFLVSSFAGFLSFGTLQLKRTICVSAESRGTSAAFHRNTSQGFNSVYTYASYTPKHTILRALGVFAHILNVAVSVRVDYFQRNHILILSRAILIRSRMRNIPGKSLNELTYRGKK